MKNFIRPVISRRAFAFILFVLSTADARADIGSSYWMYASITMQNGTSINGYFNLTTYELAIMQTDSGFYYHRMDGIKALRSNSVQKYETEIAATDYHFHEYIQRLMFDTVWVYPAITVLRNWQPNAVAPIAVYHGQPTSLAVSGIKGLVVHKVWECEPGTSVFTACEIGDRSWLTGEITHWEEDFGNTYFCNYTALYFGASREEARPLMEKLVKLYKQEFELYEGETGSEAAYQHLHQLITQTLDELRKHKIIVIGFCSC